MQFGSDIAPSGGDTLDRKIPAGGNQQTYAIINRDLVSVRTTPFAKLLEHPCDISQTNLNEQLPSLDRAEAN